MPWPIPLLLHGQLGLLIYCLLMYGALPRFYLVNPVDFTYLSLMIIPNICDFFRCNPNLMCPPLLLLFFNMLRMFFSEMSSPYKRIGAGNFILSMLFSSHMELFIGSHVPTPINKMGVWRDATGTLWKRASLYSLVHPCPKNIGLKHSKLSHCLSTECPLLYLTTSPDEMLMGCSPDYLSLRVYGS